MNNDTLKKLIHDFIDEHSIGVLATVTPGGKSEAAVITITVTDNSEVIFETFTNYRKYKNLKNNPSASLVIGWDKKITVQYDGEAHELTGDDLIKYKEKYFKKHPKLRNWDNLPEMIWFIIRPIWARYLDNNTDPRTIYELNF